MPTASGHESGSGGPPREALRFGEARRGSLATPALTWSNESEQSGATSAPPCCGHGCRPLKKPLRRTGVNLSSRGLKAAREPGRTRRRLGAWPSASASALATGPGRRRSAGAESSRSHGAARRRGPVTGLSWPRPCRWPVPTCAGSRAGPHDGQMRAGRCCPSADSGYEAPPPRKSGAVQLRQCLVIPPNLFWRQI